MVLKLTENVTVDAMGMKKTIPLILAEGMIGAAPVFKTKKDAKKSAGKKYKVLKIEAIKL